MNEDDRLPRPSLDIVEIHSVHSNAREPLACRASRLGTVGQRRVGDARTCLS